MENDDNLKPDETKTQAQPLDDGNAEILTAKQKRAREIQKNKGKGSKTRKSHWAIKATVITFFLSAFFSFISEMTQSAGNIIVTILLLAFLILGSIVFDGIGVAVAACEIAPLNAMASKKIKGSKMAIKLVNNADVVSSICNDVIGDIFGILSGACTVVIAVKVTASMATVQGKILTIVISAIVSAMIVGGKAFLKNYAIFKSKELVMMTARVLSVFTREGKRKPAKKEIKADDKPSDDCTETDEIR